jgi:uncharacterized protein YndB with AHSA1/START domain
MPFGRTWRRSGARPGPGFGFWRRMLRSAHRVLDPLEIEFEVRVPPARAFEIWTTRIGSWWPKSHTATGGTGVEVVLEARAGGRIYERSPAGEEHEWGEVIEFEPPHRLAYLWHIRRDRTDATRVEITFIARGTGATSIRIEHTGWERLGADAESWRDRNRGAWGSLLPSYQQAVETLRR